MARNIKLRIWRGDSTDGGLKDVVPVRMYFNHKGIAKVQIAIAKGKKQHDKRHTKKARDWEREKSRVFRKS